MRGKARDLQALSYLDNMFTKMLQNGPDIWSGMNAAVMMPFLQCSVGARPGTLGKGIVVPYLTIDCKCVKYIVLAFLLSFPRPPSLFLCWFQARGFFFDYLLTPHYYDRE